MSAYAELYSLRQLERELYPPLHQLRAERRQITPRRIQKPAERFLPEVLLDRLPTKGV